MSLLPTRRKKIESKMKALKCSQHFSHCKFMVNFFRRSRAANSALHGPIRLNLELSPDFMIVLVTFKHEERLQSNMKELECSQHYTLIFQTPKGSLLRSLWWDLAKIEIHTRLSCMSSLRSRMKKIQSKLKALEWPQRYMTFFQVQWQITP